MLVMKPSTLLRPAVVPRGGGGEQRCRGGPKLVVPAEPAVVAGVDVVVDVGDRVQLVQGVLDALDVGAVGTCRTAAHAGHARGW